MESKKRTGVSNLLLRHERNYRLLEHRKDYFSPQLNKQQSESLAGTACLCLQELMILKDIRFLEKTKVYLWRIREGFLTRSEP